MAEKRRRLQASILEVLTAGPRTLDAVAQALPEFRRDNVTRAADMLANKGLIESRDQAPAEGDWHLSGPAMLSLPASLPASARGRASLPERGASKHVEYAAFTRAFLSLAAGNPLTVDELFPPRSVTRKFAQRAMETLQRLNLVGPVLGDRVAISDPNAFRDTWADERLFCSALGRECSNEQAESMRVLLDGGSLRVEAAAAAFLYRVIGQENIARRTGLSSPTVMALRRVAALPAEVQEAMEADNLGARWILGFPSTATPAEIMDAIEGARKPTRQDPGEQAPLSLTGTPGFGFEEPSIAEMLATCVKLSAFTAEAVAKMERKVDFLAKELGYQGE